MTRSSQVGNGSFVPVPAVVRAVAIIELLSASGRSRSLSEISAELGLPKSSTLGICRTLVSEGLLQQSADHTYGVGVRMVRLAGKHVADIDIAQEFHRVLEVRGPLQWTIQLAVLDERSVVYLARRDGPRSLSLPSMTGRALPASTTAVGKAILAQFTREEIADLYEEHELPKRTPSSITSLADLHSALEDVRTKGYSVDASETTQGVWAVGAPVWSFGKHRPAAAVSIAVAEGFPNQRDAAASLGEQVIDVASEISGRMGA